MCKCYLQTCRRSFNNYQPNKLPMLQTGQVTTPVLTKGDVTELETNKTHCCPIWDENSYRNRTFFAVCFSHVSFLHFSVYFSFQMYNVGKISSCQLALSHGQMLFSPGTMRRKILNTELEQKQKVL